MIYHNLYLEFWPKKIFFINICKTELFWSVFKPQNSINNVLNILFIVDGFLRWQKSWEQFEK